MKYFLFLFLFLSVGWLHCRSQRVAVSVNALPAIDGAFEAGVSYAIGNKSTVELTGSLLTMETGREICEPLLADTARI